MARKLSPDPDHVHCEHVAAFEAEVAMLKKRLAAAGKGDPLDAIAGPVKRTGGDPFAHLAAQDAAYMRKKLGGGKA